MNLNERKQLDRRVRESADLLADIIGSAMDAIIATDDAQRIVLFNAAAEKIFACSANEAIGSSVERFIPERFRAGHGMRVRRFGESGVSNRTLRGLGTLWGLRATGEEFPMEASISQVESGGRKYFSVVIRDITDRKLAEEELARANERLHLAIESGSAGGWDFNLKTDTSIWFGKAHAQLGMTPEETLGSRQEFWDRVHEDDRKLLRNAMRVAKENREEFLVDFRVFWRDGTTHWLRSRGRYHYATNGEPERMLGISLDITQSKQAEQALRESEHRFLLAAQAGKMYSFEWDVKTGAVLRSPEYVAVLGATEQSHSTHRQFVDRMYPDDRPKFIATISGLTPDNPTGIVTFRVVNPDGSLVWLRSSGRAFFDDHGRMLRVIGMVADVTDQKVAEEKLSASEERLRLAQWAARIGTFDFNIRTGVNIWTPETEALYGLPPGGFGGTLAAFENLIHPDDRERIVELTHEMMRTGQATEAEWRVVWPDGSVHWIAARAQALKDESGKPSRMLGVNLDITERKLADEALAGMTRKLIEAQEQDRTRIGRDLHDDINQQLALLAVEIDRLRRDPGLSSAKIKSQLTEVRDRIHTVATGVQSLSHQLHSPQLELLGIVGATRSLCREFAARQEVNIDFTHDDVPETVAHEVSLCLFRVLQEALHNAVKHSNVRHYEVRLSRSANELHLTVSDRGIGFDATTAMSGGGLGLVSMRERVRLVNGTIVIDSKPMGGTTIHIRVPFSEQGSQRAAG